MDTVEEHGRKWLVARIALLPWIVRVLWAIWEAWMVA